MFYLVLTIGKNIFLFMDLPCSKTNAKKVFVTLAILLMCQAAVAGEDSVTIVDGRHYSNVFGETRNYRVFLPPGYDAARSKKYPVIYFFHGWSQRYFGSSNPYGDFDKGEDNGGDNIANFVSGHEVIVVKADGYNRSPDEVYYVRPYNVSPVETYRQFPIYFPELVDHIDTHYRTIADRNHRGIAGLSMGGFMTFWIGGKYPHLLSAAGNFCGSPEFEAGPKDFPIEYRHLDMYKNYEGMKVRLHYGDKDFIRGYHADLNRVWPQVMDNYDYKVFDAAHSTCGMGEMLGFILKTFKNPPAVPSRWHHTDVYPVFSVWDYNFMTDRTQPGFTVIENVERRGFRSAVRSFLPDGELMPSVAMTVTTPAIYGKNEEYVINDLDTRTSRITQRIIRSDNDGRLIIALDGSSHEIGINSKTDEANLAITSVDLQARGWATAGEVTPVVLTILNKGLSASGKIQATLSATRPSARVVKGDVTIGSIPVNKTEGISVSFVVNVDTVEVERFRLSLRDDKQNEWVQFFEIRFQRKLNALKDFVIADGKTFAVADAGNSMDTLELGRGNGDGVANPGESIVILVRDQGKLWRTDLTGKDPHVNARGINIRKSDSWSSFDHVGASAKYDVPLISSDCPQNHRVQFAVEYWLPEYPLHIIRRGQVAITVKGKDTTAPAIGRVLVTGDNVLSAKLYDGSMIKNATATFTEIKDGKKTFQTSLTDDGRNGDRAPADHVFSQTIPSQVFGIFKVEIEVEDAFGNKARFEPEEEYVVH